jgi:hypothetical protein
MTFKQPLSGNLLLSSIKSYLLFRVLRQRNNGVGGIRAHTYTPTSGYALTMFYCWTAAAHLDGFMTSDTSMAYVTRDVICVLRKFRHFESRFNTDFLQKAPVRWINGENRVTAFVDSVLCLHTDNTSSSTQYYLWLTSIFASYQLFAYYTPIGRASKGSAYWFIHH